jgi:hypothetical protein
VCFSIDLVRSVCAMNHLWVLKRKCAWNRETMHETFSCEYLTIYHCASGMQILRSARRQKIAAPCSQTRADGSLSTARGRANVLKPPHCEHPVAHSPAYRECNGGNVLPSASPRYVQRPSTACRFCTVQAAFRRPQYTISICKRLSNWQD